MMFIKMVVFIAVVSLFFCACTVRTYKVTRERIDQELVGNRGYLQGTPERPVGERKPTRTIQQVEIELRSPIKFEKVTSKKQAVFRKQDKELWGNLGYIERKSVVSEAEKETLPLVSGEKYTVQENDTLQKISLKFYGTTRYWYRIYEVNRDIIADPNKIYPGQIINIPQVKKVEEKRQPPLNLK